MAATRPSIMSEGRDHVGPRVRLIDRLGAEDAHRLVVDDDVAAHHAVVPVARVRVEGDIGDQADVGHLRLDRAARAADQIAGVQGLAAQPVA